MHCRARLQDEVIGWLVSASGQRRSGASGHDQQWRAGQDVAVLWHMSCGGAVRTGIQCGRHASLGRGRDLLLCVRRVVGMLAAATAGFGSVLTRPPAHAYLGNLASGPGWIRRRSGLLKLHQPDSSFEFPI
jgi:hypothetical protein